MRSVKKPVRKVTKKPRARNARQQAVFRARIKYGVLGLIGFVMMLGTIWTLQERYPQKALAYTYSKAIGSTGKMGFRVTAVSVAGNHRASNEAIIKASGLTDGTLSLSVDLAEVQGEVEQLDWVKTATVMRRLPKSISIKIVERKPIALWQHQKKHFLVDYKGDVITDKNIEDFVHLPVIVGNEAAYQAPKVLDIVQNFPVVSERVKALVFVNGRRWDLHLEGEMVAKLPARKLPEALGRLSEMLEKADLEGDDVQVIDLRVRGKTYLRLSKGNKLLAKVKGKVA